MRNLFSTRIKVIIVVAVLLAAALTVLSNVTGQTIPDMVMQAAMAPFRAAGNALTKQAEQYYSYMFRYEALAAENEQLKAEIAQMEDVARQADAVSRENAPQVDADTRDCLCHGSRFPQHGRAGIRKRDPHLRTSYRGLCHGDETQ